MMKSVDKTKKKLHKYVKNTSLIRDLSSPSVGEAKSAEDYRDILINNFMRIGKLAKENNDILRECYFPMLNDEESFSREDIETIVNFSKEMINGFVLSFLDIPMVYRQSLYFLKNVEKIGNEADIIIALDNMVTVAYAMISITGRVYPVSDICLAYQKEGLKAARRLLSYLDHDKFKKLDDDSKELILINSRYIRVVSEIDGVPYSDRQKKKNIQNMKDALALADDPFYKKQLPNYDWNYHIFRTLEYIASYTDLNNMQGFKKNDLKFINESTKRLKEMYDSDPEYYESIHNAKVLDLCLCRNQYLVNEISLDEYKERLIEITELKRKEKSSINSLAVLYAPLEYILVLDKDNITKQDREFLDSFYKNAIYFMHQTPKKNSLMFLLTVIEIVLKNFVEIPGGMDFETLCLSMIAAIHPPTYVHTCNVADLSLCITKHLFNKNPKLFKDIPFIKKTKDKHAQAKDLQNYVYHAALCHDFGKLIIAETILTYGRDLLEEEFDLVRSHPKSGAQLLMMHESTRDYADIALGHHKWYNDKEGYPEDFKLKKSPYKTIVEIVACADCLDAATDAVGRSYKSGISLDDFLEELKNGSGTRYAPYLYDILTEEDARKEIEDLVTSGRDINYHKMYNILKEYDES